MTKNQSKKTPLLVQNIDKTIYMIRGQKVMLDEDLAKLYVVETRILNLAIRRNIERFPNDFMFQLIKKEFINLMSQTVTSRWGGRRKMPFVFTEHGTVMLASVLKSKRAIQMNIEIIKAFIRLRRILPSQQDVLKQISEIRSFILKRFNKADQESKKVWKAIEALNKPSNDNSIQPIGFRIN